MAGEFLNNPLVAAIGNHLGLSGLMGDSTETTTQAVAPPPKPGKSSVQTPREFRHTAPLPKSSGSQSRGLGPGGLSMPGVMSADVLMHPEVQKLLGQYGVSPEQIQSTVQNANPNLFVTNPNAFDKHPVLSGLLEHGLEGLAFTHGGITTGESISNVAQGLAAANAARTEKYNAQLMMPFQQAQQVAGLQNIAVEQHLKEAQAEYDRQHAEYFSQLPELRRMLMDQQQQYHQGLLDNKNAQMNMVNLLGKDPKMFSYLSGDDAKAWQQTLGQYGHILNVPPDLLSSFAEKAQKAQALAETTARKAVRATPTTSIHIGSGNTKPDYTPEKEDYSEALRVEKGIEEEQKQFLGALNAGHPATDSDGMLVAPGDTDSINRARTSYKKRWDEAHKNTKSISDKMKALRVPGAGMTKQAPSAGRNPRYNPATGKVE